MTASDVVEGRLSFCPRCYTALAKGSTLCSSCDGGPAAPAPEPGIKGLSDRLTDTLGVERLEEFSAKAFFSDLFKRRTPEEVEAHFAWGFPGHVPNPAAIEAEWPRPWSFLRVLAAALAAYFAFSVAFAAYQNTNLIPGLIMTGSFAVPMAMVVFFYEMNIFRNISVYHLARLFLLGGVAALVLALILFAVFPVSSLVGAAAAGPVEEAAKLAIVGFSLGRMRLGSRPRLLNAILVGAAVGAGFAAFESAGYAFQVLSGELGGVTVVDVIAMRGLLSPFSHIAWTAISAAALWRISDGSGFSTGRLGEPRFLQLFLLAVALHALWDVELPVPALAKYAALAAAAALVVLSLLQTGIREADPAHTVPSRTTAAQGEVSVEETT